MILQNDDWQGRWLVSVFLGALSLCLPAMWNGFPFLYPDSVDYVRFGPIAYRDLFTGSQGDYGIRSICYCLSILPLHANISTVWPVVFVQALSTSWLVALCCRREGLKPTRYLVGMLLLGVFSGAGWTASYLLPDILASVTILSSYWITLGRGYLSGAQRVGVFLLLTWSVVAHASHLLLAAGLLAGLLVLGRWRQIGWGVAAVFLALGLQWSLHARLLQRGSVFGNPPPFLLARLVQDGPLLRFLREHGQEHGFVLARYLDQMKPEAGDFLWSPRGVYQNIVGKPDILEQIQEQQNALVWATLVHYPEEQLLATLRNLLSQFVCVGLPDYTPDPYTQEQWPLVAPQLLAAYRDSRQFRDGVDGKLVGGCHVAVVALAVLLIVWRWRRLGASWRQLATYIFLGLWLNAAICGCISGVHGRYQARVAWLLPMLAGLSLGATPKNRRVV